MWVQRPLYHVWHFSSGITSMVRYRMLLRFMGNTTTLNHKLKSGLFDDLILTTGLVHFSAWIKS